MLSLQLGNEEFVRGVSGSVWFRLENSGQEEIEIIAATNAGKQNSSTIRYQLVDADGNVLVTAPFKQIGTADLVTLKNGNVVTRIPAGEAFISLPTEILIPSGVPDELTVRLIIDKISYHQTREDEVNMQGLAGEFQLILKDTSYYGEIGTADPAVSTGDEDIVISGRAIDRETGISLGFVPLKLTVTVAGYERTVDVETDEVGAFSYTFTPLDGESGTFQLRAVHPDLLDKPVQGSFVITKVIVNPTNINLAVPRNYQQNMPIKISTGAGTELNNLRLLYAPEDQDGGVLPDGVFVTPGDPVVHIGQKQTVTIPISLWANNLATASGKVVLKVVSDESGPDGWGLITINTAFSTAKPVLAFKPTTLETGVIQDGIVTETIKLTNKGLAALEQVVLNITNLNGTKAPSWVHLVIKPELGDIEIGQERDVPISFSPGQAIAPGPYQFVLNVTSDNYTATPIYLFAIVNQDGQGHILFKASDIYTGTPSGDGGLVEGLAGASITLQNEDTLVSQQAKVTDALGEAEYRDLPAGWYKFRITAKNHQEQISRIYIKPGLTSTKDIFMEYNLVTVSWEVNEITIEDRYEIVLTATFESDVPAPVVIAEPGSLTLPALKTGMVMNGEFTLTNHGFIRADDLQFRMPASDAHFKFELLEGMPTSLNAKQTITVPYRITCLKSLDQEDGSGGGCATYRACATVPYKYECANGVGSGGSTSHCWTYTYGSCGGGGGTSGTGGGSYYYGGTGGSTSAYVPVPQKLSGAKCLPKPNKECPKCDPNAKSKNSSINF
jgi:stage V sporulation protein SpoVS